VKILLLGANVSYLNPTPSLLPTLLGEVGEVVAWGPGFVSSDEILRGIERFVEKNGPFNLIVATEHFINPDSVEDPPSAEASYRRNYNLTSGVREYLSRLRASVETMKQTSIPRCSLLLETDPYTVSRRFIEEVDEWSDIIVGWGDQFVPRIENLEGLAEETFASRATNRYTDFVRTNRTRVFSCPAFLSHDEFTPIRFASRSSKCSVVGSPYIDRKVARSSLRVNGLGWRGRELHYISAVLSRYFPHLIGKASVQRALNWRFRRILDTSMFSFTCGSRLRYPIRKFFEIPASGSILLTPGFSGMSDLGFEAGKNFILCEASSIAQEVRRLQESDISALEGLSGRLQQIVMAEHTVSARALQLRAAFDLLANGTFRGAKWSEGTLIFSQ
jgi:hypothetical protein